MKRILSLLLFAAFIYLPVSAGDFVPVAFGTAREKALDSFISLWGRPVQEDERSVTFLDKRQGGYLFNRIVVGFEDSDKGGYFNQIRFFIVCPTRQQAISRRDALSRTLGDIYKYGVTYDYEENGNKYYKGGISPKGIGFLFTIYTQRLRGKWTTELRYGAFHKLNKIE